MPFSCAGFFAKGETATRSPPSLELVFVDLGSSFLLDALVDSSFFVGDFSFLSVLFDGSSVSFFGAAADELPPLESSL